MTPDTSAADLVAAFLHAAARRDYATALPLLTDDVVYQNMMLPAVTGHDAVRETLEGLLALCSESDWLTHRQLVRGDAEDGLVMNERTDRFLLPSGWCDLPVMGVFELRGGKVAAWRDYFDLQTVLTAMGA